MRTELQNKPEKDQSNNTEHQPASVFNNIQFTTYDRSSICTMLQQLDFMLLEQEVSRLLSHLSPNRESTAFSCSSSPCQQFKCPRADLNMGVTLTLAQCMLGQTAVTLNRMIADKFNSDFCVRYVLNHRNFKFEKRGHKHFISLESDDLKLTAF